MNPLRVLAFLLCAGLVAAAQTPAAKTPAAKTPAAKTKEPDPALLPAPETPGLPRVLLIGDSISMGYTLPVRERLAGKANVQHPPENCSDSATGLRKLDKWLGEKKWDVIHFNFGLHDLKYLDEKGNYVAPEKGKQVALLPVYEKNLRALVARLQQTGAKLIFATTTPVPAQSNARVEHDELRYNEVAVRVMRELGVPVDDLHAVVVPLQQKIQLPHNVHFTPEGYRALADAVVAAIAPVLPVRR